MASTSSMVLSTSALVVTIRSSINRASPLHWGIHSLCRERVVKWCHCSCSGPTTCTMSTGQVLTVTTTAESIRVLANFLRTSWPTQKTRNLVLFMLTRSTLFSMPAFYVLSLEINSYLVSTMSTRPSAWRSSHGTIVWKFTLSCVMITRRTFIITDEHMYCVVNHHMELRSIESLKNPLFISNTIPKDMFRMFAEIWRIEILPSSVDQCHTTLNALFINSD